jgi:hypothetical protein
MSAVGWGAVAVAAINGLAAALGGLRYLQGGESRLFWPALRSAQLAGVIFAIAVGVLTAAGRRPSEELFYLYALLPIAVAFIAEQFRLSAAAIVLAKHGFESAQEVASLPEAEQYAIAASILRREMGVMALSALVIVGLALRAAQTAHGI